MPNSIGETIRYHRYLRHWTMSDLAKCAQIPIGTISLLERGLRHGDNLTVLSVRRLAKALGISVDELIGEEAPAARVGG